MCVSYGFHGKIKHGKMGEKNSRFLRCLAELNSESSANEDGLLARESTEPRSTAAVHDYAMSLRKRYVFLGDKISSNVDRQPSKNLKIRTI